MKIVLLIIVLFFAVGIAMALLARLTRIQQQLAELKRDLDHNDIKMHAQRERLERMAAEKEVEKQGQDLS